MDLMKILTHPIRLQILQVVQNKKAASAREISEALPDIAPATLYRHVQALSKEKILIVKEERKVRGSIERILEMNPDFFSNELDTQISSAAWQFLMNLYQNFYHYETENKGDPKKDRLCLRSSILHLSDENFDQLLIEMGELIERYQHLEENGKVRSLSIISSPITDYDYPLENKYTKKG